MSRVLLWSLTLAGLVLSGGGCFGPACKTPTYSGPDRRPGHVYIFRGFWNVFSPGLADLRAELNAQKIDAHDLNCGTIGHVIDAVTELRSRGDREPIFIGGYSKGGEDALRTAWALAERGIEIDVVFLIDGVLLPPAPRNIRRIVNFHLSPGDSAVAIAEPHGPWRAAPEVVPVFLANHWAAVHHTKLHADARMHQRLIAEVIGVSERAQRERQVGPIPEPVLPVSPPFAAPPAVQPSSSPPIPRGGLVPVAPTSTTTAPGMVLPPRPLPVTPRPPVLSPIEPPL